MDVTGLRLCVRHGTRRRLLLLSSVFGGLLCLLQIYFMIVSLAVPPFSIALIRLGGNGPVGPRLCFGDGTGVCN